MKFEQAVALADKVVSERIFDPKEAVQVSALDLGIDIRAFNHNMGKVAWADRGGAWLAIPLAYNRSCRYYAGFEYVDDEYIMQIGTWVFYSTEDSRMWDLEHIVRHLPRTI